METKEIEKIGSESENLISLIEKLEIKNENENITAGNFLKTIKDLRKKIEDIFNPSVKSAKESYDDIRHLRDTYLDTIEKTERKLRDKIGFFLTQEERKRIELQRIEQEKYEKKIIKAEEKGQKLLKD